MRSKGDVKLLYSSDLLDGFPDYFLIKIATMLKRLLSRIPINSIIINLIRNLSPGDRDKHEKQDS